MLSVDVEDWFHLVGAGLDYQFRGSPGDNSAWEHYIPRVEENTRWILDLLDRHGVKATFFVLGWVAEHHPSLVREIHTRGHEIASHSYWHKVLRVQDHRTFREDVRRSVDVLESVTSSKVLGFRASSASIADWATDILCEEGLLYDSSLFPVLYHDVYGKLSGTDARRPIEQLSNGLWEVKFSSLRVKKMLLPWSGGGYFRLFPYHLFRAGVRRILAEQQSYQFYIHPWEIDAAAPRLRQLKAPYYFRRYVSIERTRARLAQLLSEFRFVTLREGLSSAAGLRFERTYDVCE